MTRVRFFKADGSLDREVDVAPGTRLLDAAQNEDQPLEGTCEGQMACSTCHVIVTRAEGADLPPPAEEEEDMLDFAYGAVRESRLACQLYASEKLRELDLRMPGGAVDVSRAG